MKLTNCHSGLTNDDCVAMSEASVCLTMKEGSTDVTKKNSDLVLDGDFQLILEAIKLGRNMHENLRKFVQYQATISINLVIYIALGQLLFKDIPIHPPIILLINFLMDTFASLILSCELPLNDTLILRQSEPYQRDSHSLFTPQMKMTVFSSTLYQQIVLYLMFYNGYMWLDIGSTGPTKSFSETHMYDEGSTKGQAYTFIFHTFFMMQIFNLFNCRITYEQKFPF